MAASDHPDAWLWVAMVAIGYYAAWGIHRQLVHVCEAVEITKPEKAPEMVDEKTEDAIKLDALAQLSESPNPDIRDAAVKIIKARALKSDSVWDGLLQGLKSMDASRRKKALVVLDFLASERATASVAYERYQEFALYSALVVCLVNLVPDLQAALSAGVHPSESQVIATELLEFNVSFNTPRSVPKALEAGLVSKWLAIFPFDWYVFGEERPSKRREALEEFMEHVEDSEFAIVDDLKQIVRSILETPDGRVELCDAGLWRPSAQEDHRVVGTRHGVSPAEARARMRRREAVIIGS